MKTNLASTIPKKNESHQPKEKECHQRNVFLALATEFLQQGHVHRLKNFQLKNQIRMRSQQKIKSGKVETKVKDYCMIKCRLELTKILHQQDRVPLPYLIRSRYKSKWEGQTNL